MDLRRSTPCLARAPLTLVRHRHARGAGVLGILAVVLVVASAPRPAPSAATARALPRPPLFFVAHDARHASDVAFTVVGRDVEAAFDGGGVTFTRVLPAPRASDEASGADTRSGGSIARGLRIDADSGRPVRDPAPERSSARLVFVGARADARPAGRAPLATRIHLLRGPREQWRRDIPTFAELVYRDLWPGIDLEYRAADGALKYQFVVRPGADPAAIQLAWQGARGLRLDAAGALEIELERGSLLDGRPVAFQPATDGASIRRVTVDFALEDLDVRVPASMIADEPIPEGRPSGAHPEGALPSDPPLPVAHGLRFALGDYDPSRVLVIDPAVPVYAGFFGTSAYDRGLGIDVDAAGHAYLCGETIDPDGGDTDAFVARVALDGSGYDFITIIGGDGYDAAYDVAVDDAGHAYLTGATMSDEGSFPVTGGPDLSFNGVVDVLVAKVAPDGSDLVYAGYLGGELTDFGEGVRVDGSGAAYLHGIVLSNEATFPVKVGPDLSFNGETDAFVAKLSPAPSAADVADNLIYAGYIGGDRSDITAIQEDTWSILSSGHIAIDDRGALYVSGETTSTEASFPDGDGFGDLPGADRSWAGDWDAYIVKVAPDGSRLVYATYVGGEGADMGKGMAVDAAGRAWMTGNTTSTEATMPVTNGPDLSANGDYDALVAALSPAGDAFELLGFIGGDDTDGGEAIALDGRGRAYIVGYTESTADTFPVAGGPDLSHNDAVEGAGDAFVLRLAPDPSAEAVADNVEFAGYIGGAGYDQAFWLALDGAGGVYVAGDTDSGADTFPDGDGLGDLPGPLREAPGGPGDGFVFKLDADGVAPTPVPGPDPSQGAIYLPSALTDATIGSEGGLTLWAPVPAWATLPGGASDPPTSVSAGPRAVAPAQEPGGPQRVPRSYDDFCDFAVGWVWDEDAEVEIHPEIDLLGHCTFVMRRLTEGAYGGFSSNVPTPEDFHLATSVEMQGENGLAGLLFGASERLDAMYAYILLDPGEYLLARIGGSGTTLLDRGAVDFDTSRPISLGVSALDETLMLYVDGAIVAEVPDAGPHAGRVGTYVEGSAGSLPFTARFDWIRFDELVAEPPAGPTPQAHAPRRSPSRPGLPSALRLSGIAR